MLKRKRVSHEEIVKIVTQIRGRNNRNWMALLKLALKAKPRLAKNILREIVKNDAKITTWMNRV